VGWWRDRANPDGHRTPHTVMTASGRRLDLADRALVSTISAARAGWQTDAWDYRGLVGELAAALRFRANALSKVALKIGQVAEGEDEPIDADSDQCTLPDALKKAAQDCLDHLPWRDGYSFLGVLDTCFSVAGEAWLHGRPATPEDGVADGEVWTVLSTDEVTPVGGAGRLGIVVAPGKPPRPIDPAKEALIRLWVPDPRFKLAADSPLRSIRDVLEDIVLAGREIRAAARSRIASNGILLITDSMSITRRSTDEADEPDDFASTLEAAMLAPIANEGDAGAVVPIVVQGDKEDIAAARLLRLERETSADIDAKLQRRLTRMAESIDVPPTVVTGMQDTNHWNAYVIDATTWRNHLEPGCRIEVDSLTVGYLRSRLTMPINRGGYGFSAAEAAQVVIWYDAGKVTENANRGQDAKDAYDRFAIGAKALRDALGWNDDDAPSDQELMVMLASKVSPDPATAGALIQRMLGTQLPVPTVVQTQPSALPPGQEQPAAQPTGQPVAPERAPSTEQTPPGARTAAATPGVDLRVVTGDKLAAIDAALLERLLVAADDAVSRALEKATARVRSASVNRVDRAEVDAHRDDLAAWLGEDRVGELGLATDALLAAAFAGLAVKFTDWTTSAIRQSVKATAALLGLPLESVAALTRVLTARVPAAWDRLHEALRTRAQAHLYGRAGTELRGESPEGMVLAGDIRTALAQIGGAHVAEGGVSDTPLGGIALGPTLTEQINRHAGPAFGMVWQYGPEPRNTFHPHLRLDDHRFDGPDDARLAPPPGYEWLGGRMHPGDHPGCRCHVVPAWIFPRNFSHLAPATRAVLAQVSAPESEPASLAAIRSLAAGDDAAGRTGTVAQQQRDVADRVLRMRTDWLASGQAA
jgi:hypothetical protein